ncbi:hypothetical protein [Saccharothrix sp. HUAS TT1]|uniref:hypothetical protein n=1 Tax=unclassified Saccharothrix TaxID=2593673 RepID=UPI00345B8012
MDDEHTDPLRHDPETRRLSTLLALRTWAVQAGGDPSNRASLVVLAWEAGEHRLVELARAAGVDQQTVFEDLLRRDVTPRGLPSDTPSPELLEHRHVAVLADRLSQVLLPTMIGPVTEPLASVAWTAHQVLEGLAKVLDPHPEPDFDRVAWLAGIAEHADGLRRDIHRQLAAECTDAQLATLTTDTADAVAELGTAAYVEAAELRLIMADGLTRVRVDLDRTARPGEHPAGWSQWSGTAALDPVDRVRHLELSSLLRQLSEIVTGALPAALVGLDA